MNRNKKFFRMHTIKPLGLTRFNVVIQIAFVSAILLSASAYIAPPVANDDSYSMRPNTTLSVDAVSGVLANDSDPDGDPVSVQTFSSPENGTINMVTDGSFTYTPDENFVGVEEVNYTITDGNETATSILTIEVTNQPPIANDDTYTIRPNTTLSVDAESGVLINDSDPDGDPIRVILVSSAESGTISIVTDGSFTYTPNEKFVGVETLTYTISDGAERASATLTIVVTNAPPIANDDTYTMRPNTTLSVDAESGVLINDSDPDGDPIRVILISSAESGTISIVTDGSFTYTPNEKFVGVETLTYTISDGAETAEATLTIKVEDNHPPVAKDDSYRVQPNTELVVDSENGLLANDTDPDGDTIIVESSSTAQNGVFIVLSLDGAFTYVPDTDFVGVETVTYTITDGPGIDTGTVTINVTNQPPVANDDTYRMQPNTELVVDSENGLLANDTDSDGDIIIVESSSTALNGVFIVLSLDGAFTYVPDTDFVGVETITYTITDGPGIDTGTVTIMVDENQTPLAVNDLYSTEVGALLTVNAESGVLANDSDPDGNTLEIASFTEAENGDLNIAADGSFAYQPYDGFIGRDFVAYTVSNGSLTSDGMLYIDVMDTPPMSVNSCEVYDPRPLSRGFGGNWMEQEDEKAANFYVPASQRGGGIIKATLSAGHASIKPRLRVCINSSCSGGSIVTHTAIEENSATVEFQAAPGQDYHFDILQFGNAPEDDYPVAYSLSVSYEDRIDCWEGNNTLQQAKQINIGDEVNSYMIEGYRNNFLQSGEYADWYAFELEQEAFIDINMTQPPGMHLMRLKLFDEPVESAASILLEGQQEDKGQPFVATTTSAKDPGTYYLRIGTLLSENGFVSGPGDQPEHWNQEYKMIVDIQTVTSADEEELVPSNFILSQNFPNPFNPSTTIEFAIPRAEKVRLEVFNSIGKQISLLLDKQMPAGNHNVIFDASNLPSGIYIYRLQAGSFVENKKLTLIK